MVWTPLALALAIGWPAALFYRDDALAKTALAAGAGVFAIALLTLGASWALGIAPRARRTVVLHVLLAGAFASLIAPFILTELLSFVADSERGDGGESFTLTMSLSLAPLALVLGLPMVLVSGITFAWVALTRPRPPGDASDDDMIRRSVVQPFR